MDAAAPQFHFLGPAHLVVIAITLLAPFVLAQIGKRDAVDFAIRIGIAAILAVNFIAYGVRGCLLGTLTLKQALPLQLCDWTMIAVIVASLNGGDARWLEVIYFWGIGGSLQAVLTPNLRFGFPDYRFFTFFIDHALIVIGISYLMLTRRFRPQLRSIWRTWLWSIVWFAVTLVVDGLTNVNYGFLLHKPEAFSILTYLSDWRPLYLLQLNLLALCFFAILYVPFLLADLARRDQKQCC